MNEPNQVRIDKWRYGKNITHKVITTPEACVNGQGGGIDNEWGHHVRFTIQDKEGEASINYYVEFGLDLAEEIATGMLNRVKEMRERIAKGH